tara:strand:- start:1345 stop:2457 length:1113 start_codon:yes stop_codon:yes gene_type:complete
MEVEDGAISADEAWQICETWFRSRRVVWGNDDVANRDGVRVSRDPGFEATQGGVTIGDAIVDAIDEAIVVTGRDSCERFDVHFLRSISTRHCEKAFFSERPRSRPRSSQRPRATCDMRSLQWTRDLFSGGRKRKRVDARARPTIFSLPQDLIATHILGAANMPDLADLARLRAVSHEMCDAVAQSGRHVREIDVYEAVKLGCLSTLQRLRPQGCLGFSVDNGRRLVRLAVKHGQLEILKWLAANGWSLDKCLCAKAAKGGHLEAIQWLSRERLPVGRKDVRERGGGQAPRVAAVGARERLSVGQVHVLVRGGGRAPRGAPVGARERLPVGLGNVRVGGDGQATRGAAVGSRERLPVGLGNVQGSCGERRF